MLYITVPDKECFDEKTQTFFTIKGQTLQLEHSLVSLSKWESKWCKAFFSKREKSFEETVDYIKCMTLTQNVRPEVYSILTRENIEQINKYIESPMTATHFSDVQKSKASNEVVTNELIYYWMISLNVPVKFEKWHLNRLLTLIKVCEIKSQPPKKMSKLETMSRNHALNAARRKQLNTRG